MPCTQGARDAMSTAWRGERWPCQRSDAAPHLLIRHMQEEDLPVILDIERRAYSFPWSENIFRDCLRVSYHCRVAELQGVIIGYGVMAIYVDEAHLLNLCIRPESRRRGLGLRLLGHLLGEARASGARTILLEVRPSNSAAIALYRRLGFERIGRRKDYYPSAHGREDAVVLSRKV